MRARRTGREEADYVELLNERFERIGTWCYDHRWIVIVVCLVALGACAALASRVRFDNSFEAYFDRDDPAYTAYLKFREDFGSDEISYILYEAPEAPDGPWNLEVMRQIRTLTAALEEEVPFVKEVTSLANVEFIEGVPDGIVVHELLYEFPEDRDALRALRRKVLAKPLYTGGLVSSDGRYAAIVIEMKPSSVDPLEEIKLDPHGGDGLDNLYPQVTHAKIEEILARPEYAGIVFHHTGDVPLNAVYNLITESESWALGGGCFLLIAVVLVGFFRAPIGVVGPLAVVVLSVLVSVALVGVLGWKLDLMFSMLPTLLVAVGVAGSVHLISEFMAYHAELGDRREAARRTLRLVGTPCLLTSLTTAAGFGSMSIAPIKAIAHFAVYSAVGVGAAFVLSVTLLVVALGFSADVRSGAARRKDKAKGGRWFRGMLAAVAGFNIRHRTAIILVSAVVFVIAGAGIARMKVDSNFLTDFSVDVPIRRITTYVEGVMGGTVNLVYLFDSGVEGGTKEPALLREIERLQAAADREDGIVTKTYSIVDLLKDINQSFHDGDPAYHVLPETRELVAQYLLVYELSGGAELENYLSADYSRAALELRCRLTDTSRFTAMVERLDAYREAAPIRSATVATTGMGALWVELMEYITSSQIRGFLLAFTVIAALMCFIFKSVKTGMLSMVPNLTPVVLTLGAMGWFGVPLDYSRLLIGTVAIGLAVDDTIHLVTRYRHEFLRCGDYEAALRAALADVGRALFITSVVLFVGFLVFLFSVMDSQKSLGLLLGSTVVTALAADFFLMPALVLTFRPFGPGDGGRHPSAGPDHEAPS